MKKRIQSDIQSKFIKKCTWTLFALTFSSNVALAGDLLPLPDAPTLDAEAYILLDAKSGKVLAQHEADTKRDPASLTKMMTSYVVGEALKQKRISSDDKVPISRAAWALGNPVLKGSSVMFLKPGDQVTVEELNKGIIIQSGNDASIAIAEFIAGSQNAFVNMMNNYAVKLGLNNTYFQTVHGLDASGQYTTARDMALLGKALIDDLPEEYGLYKEKQFTYNNIKQINRNGLLWDQHLNVDGIKTGHTDSAGYNLVASAVDGNTRLISAVLGGRTFKGREDENRKLLNWGFRFFETVTPVQAQVPVVDERIWYGEKAEVPLGSEKAINITVPKGQASQVKMRYKLSEDSLKAPLAVGHVVGNIQFLLGDKVLEEKPLVALEKVDEAGFFSRLWDYIKLTFTRWFN